MNYVNEVSANISLHSARQHSVQSATLKRSLLHFHKGFLSCLLKIFYREFCRLYTQKLFHVCLLLYEIKVISFCNVFVLEVSEMKKIKGHKLCRAPCGESRNCSSARRRSSLFGARYNMISSGYCM